MVKFTNSPFEKMMSQRPASSRTGEASGTVSSNRCGGCSYAKQHPCIGYCIKELMGEGRLHDKGLMLSVEKEKNK